MRQLQTLTPENLLPQSVLIATLSTESSESEESSIGETSDENEELKSRSPWTHVYPPEDDPSRVSFVVRIPVNRNMSSPQ